MTRSVVGRLIAKDLYLYRWLIAGTILAGVIVTNSRRRVASTLRAGLAETQVVTSASDGLAEYDARR